MLSIPVKIESIERRKRSTSIMHVVAGFYLIGITSSYSVVLKYAQSWKAIPFYLVAITSLLYGFLLKRIDANAKYNYWLRCLQGASFLGLGIQFLVYDNSWTAISLFIWVGLVFFLMLTERKLFEQTVIELKDQGIKVPGYIGTQVIDWEIVEDFIPRADFVTILRRDQKYVQLEVTGHLSEMQLEQMAAYGKEQILKATSVEALA